MNEPQMFADLQDAGNAQAQLILQAIARHADWETGECWPGDEALAKMAKCSARTVQTYLARLEGDGLITRVDRRSESGTKMKRLITLVGYAEWISALRDGGSVTRPKAVSKYEKPPASLSGGEAATGKQIAVTTGKQSSVTTGKQAASQEHSLNNQLNSSARTREGEISDFGSEVKRALPMFEITSGCNQWEQWMAFLKSKGRDDLEGRARASGLITVVGARWPKDDSPLPIIRVGELTEKSKRMTGDVA